MDATYTSAIAEVIEKLEAGNPLPPLAPENAWSDELTNTLLALSLEDLFQGQSLKDDIFGGQGYLVLGFLSILSEKSRFGDRSYSEGS